MIAPIRTSRQAIFVWGSTLKSMANSNVMTPKETTKLTYIFWHAIAFNGGIVIFIDPTFLQ